MAVSIAFVVLLGLSADYLFRKMKLPGLVGMLTVGILCGPYVLNLMERIFCVISYIPKASSGSHWCCTT